MPAGHGKIPIVAAAGLVAANRVLLRVGARQRMDGWRRAAGLVLRTEVSTFVLSAFGLEGWSDVPGRASRPAAETRAHVAARLGRFLDGESGCHVRIGRGVLEDRAEVAAGPTYTLDFRPWVDGAARFLLPGDWAGGRAVGVEQGDDAAELLNLVCRVDDSGRVDVWMRVNHVGADGVPMQEMLSRLEAAWGGAGDVRYPTPEAFAPMAAARPIGGTGVCEVQSFMDFGPLIRWRKRENAGLGEPLTLSAAMLWCLSRRDEFAGLQMGTTVEVSPRGGLARGVGVVVVRPADYSGRGDGLARYARDFNRQVEATRRRASESCATLDAAARLPAGLAAGLLRHALENVPGAFGTMALTMLKDARVFGAPIAEVGHADGFLAVGSVGLPTDGGGLVGCVTAKGRAAVVGGYPEAIRRAVTAME